MEDLSEQAIIENCPHCNRTSQAFSYPLLETDNFFVVCDFHPLTEGHVLIIPKQHISCIAEYPKEMYEEFLMLYEKFETFVKATYGKVSTFEHGKFGQTVFHSHVHILPFTGSPIDIVPEGLDKLYEIKDIIEVRYFLHKYKGYLFFSIEDRMWTVHADLAKPRFFRDRFANALKNPQRGNWKEMHINPQLMKQGEIEDTETQKKWKEYSQKIIL